MSANSSNFNRVVFTGNLAFTPRMTSFQTKSGKSVSKTYFTVLCDNSYNGYNDTNALQCVAYGQHAKNVAKNFQKGSFVEATGSAETFSTKNIQNINLKYPITITRFSIYNLKQIKKGMKLSGNKATTTYNSSTTISNNNNNNNNNDKSTALKQSDLPF